MKVRDPYFRLERIRKYIDEDIFPTRVRESIPMTCWKYTESSMEEKLQDAYQVDYDDSDWQRFEIPQKWGGYDRVAWFRTDVCIPASFQGKQVAVRGIIGPRDGGESTAETLLYVDGHPVQAIDIWHEEAFLAPEIIENKEVLHIALKAWSGVLGVPAFRTFKEAALVVIDPYTDKFYFMIDTLLKCCEQMEEKDLRRIRLTGLLVQTFEKVDFLNYKKDSYYDSVKKAYLFIREELDKLEQMQEIKPTVTGIGHSHIDMGWLWRYSATREKASRTFSTVLNLMRQFPEYRYLHTSPQLYQFIKLDYPEIYEQIREKVKEGKWEITGGMWVESDTNLPSGESLIRQFIYGKRFMKEEFGMDSKLVWLPDVFGYSGALPQIMKKSDMDYFMTTKISWNQYNHFPYDTFLWKGIDGSEIFTHFITTPEDGSWFYTYNGRMEPEEITGIWENYKDKDKNEELLLAFGWGDGGGGPTKDMLERARVMKNIPGIPKVQIDTSENYFKRIYETIDHKKLGTWEGELYFEMHRGTYTSQARTKRNNRKTEIMMHNIEFLYSYLDMLQEGNGFPKEQLRKMWEKILLNQFHDVLPGSSIRQVYEDTDRIYASLFEEGKELLDKAGMQLAAYWGCGQKELLVINTTGFERSDVLFVPFSDSLHEGNGFEENKEAAASQTLSDGILVYVEKIPAYGFRTLTITNRVECGNEVHVTESSMENAFYQIRFNEEGQIAYLYDKTAGRVVTVDDPMNRFGVFEDKPQRFDAWDIDVYYKDKPLGQPKLIKREIISHGAVAGSIRMTYEFHNSLIVQDITIFAQKEGIEFKTNVDWKEKQVLLRVYFPVNVHAGTATYEIQCGNIERPTHTNTEWDFAKFEVCAHRWADLSEGNYGVSLLNDCKYGYDVHGNVIGLSLIKSSIRPDETADRGKHEFTYMIYPHSGDVRNCKVQQLATELNMPLLYINRNGLNEEKDHAEEGLFTTDCTHIYIDTVKKAEEEDAYIIRLYEFKNMTEKKIEMRCAFPVKRVVETNLVERELGELPVENQSFEFDIAGFEIKTFKLYL